MFHGEQPCVFCLLCVPRVWGPAGAEEVLGDRKTDEVDIFFEHLILGWWVTGAVKDFTERRKYRE